MASGVTNVAVVGCGYWGPNLVRNLSSLEGCRVKMVCYRDPARLEHLVALHPGLASTADAAEIAADPEIEGVVVATPVSSHFQIAAELLRAGKHVFIEKPMAASSEQCRSLLETARAAGRSVMVGHTFVYSAAVRKIKQIVDSGEIGEVRYVSSRRLNLGLFQKDINVAWDLAPHDLSIILYLTGKQPMTVSCQGMAHVRKGIEDVTVMSLRFPCGTFGIIHSSWIDPRKVRETTIVGSRKMIVYDDNEPLEKLKIYDKSVEVPPHYDTFAEFQFSYHYGDVNAPYLKQYEPLRLECQTFLDRIRGGDDCASTGEDGLRVVEILEAASVSLGRGGAPVEVRG
jgi:predicted dehydrogenase